MIPKRIYYIWFGGKPLNKEQKYYIGTWKKAFPDYDIIEINESNFDVNCCQMSRVAYREKWYNFVSDYARLKVIYENGGIYLDTDVEVIRDYRDIINKGAFFAFSKVDENVGYIATGLGFASEKNNPIIKELINQYETWTGNTFTNDKGYSVIPACPIFNKSVFEKWGLKHNNTLQELKGITFYPSDYFEGFDLKIRQVVMTDNTRTIHHYTSLGHPKLDRWYMFTFAKMSKKYGNDYLVVRKKMMLYYPFRYCLYHFKHKNKNTL